MTTQRDTFIGHLFEYAKNDKDIYLITVDQGAPTLDRWREELPNQFLSCGISEQHAINFAAGMAAGGKKVYVYFMAAWVARCFEQIRYSCAMAENPITILGNGVGLGYAPAGPAHEPNEDIAYMRSLVGIEIITPCNNRVTEDLIRLTIEEPKLRYIRLERKYATELDNVYSTPGVPCLSNNFLNKGVAIMKPGLSENPLRTKSKIGIISCGYMLGRSAKVMKKLLTEGHDCSVIDLWRIKPIIHNNLLECISKYDVIVTIEEQTLSGGLGSAVCEVLMDNRIKKNILRIGLPERYIFENGGRDYHLDNNGLSVDSIANKILNFVK